MGTGLITLINRLILIAAFLCSTSAFAEQVIKLASTTSTENSGLFKFLLPKFEKETKIKVRVIAAGTGQAIRIGRNGDADVLIVHHPPSEERFVAEGFGLKRHKLMYNDLVIVGPKTDSAKIRGVEEATIAFSKIASSMQLFAITKTIVEQLITSLNGFAILWNPMKPSLQCPKPTVKQQQNINLIYDPFVKESFHHNNSQVTSM